MKPSRKGQAAPLTVLILTAVVILLGIGFLAYSNNLAAAFNSQLTVVEAISEVASSTIMTPITREYNETWGCYTIKTSNLGMLNAYITFYPLNGQPGAPMSLEPEPEVLRVFDYRDVDDDSVIDIVGSTGYVTGIGVTCSDLVGTTGESLGSIAPNEQAQPDKIVVDPKSGATLADLGVTVQINLYTVEPGASRAFTVAWSNGGEPNVLVLVKIDDTYYLVKNFEWKTLG